MKKLLYAAIAVATVAFASCNANYKKSKSGMEYKIFSGKASGYNKTADSLKPGVIVKYNYSFSIARKGKEDTLINSTYDKMPQYAPYDTSSHILLTPMEPMLYAKVGDSVEFRISVDSLIAKQMVPENELFQKGATIKGKMSIINAFANQDSAKADFEKEAKAYEVREEERKKVAIVEETKQLEKYLSSKNFKATKTPMGTFVLVETVGDASAKIDSGKVAVLKYRGYTTEGKEFDSNIDTTAKKPLLEVLIGQHSVIPGFEDGLKQFNKGGKGKIFIPASLGYGNVAQPNLPANSNLIFDVEIVDVKNAPKQSAQPQFTPEQMKKIQEEMQKQQGQGK